MSPLYPYPKLEDDDDKPLLERASALVLLVGATETGITMQEVNGQRDVAQQQTLPKDMNHPKELFESLGFVFLGTADDLFYYVTYPEGWSVKPTAHSLWSDLLDAKGRKRGSIFYKAAFYDCNASVSLCHRYAIRSHVPCNEDGVLVSDYSQGYTHLCVFISDATVPNPTYVLGWAPRKSHDKHYEFKQSAAAWLDERIPDWRNPLLYWD